MIYLAIALFAVAAVLGLTILIKWLTNKNAPKGVIYSHGGVAATALVLLLVYAIQNPDNFPKVSIILFVVGALGGFYMFFSEKEKKKPMTIALIHALIVVSGFVTLLLFAFA